MKKNTRENKSDLYKLPDLSEINFVNILPFFISYIHPRMIYSHISSEKGLFISTLILRLVGLSFRPVRSQEFRVNDTEKASTFVPA